MKIIVYICDGKVYVVYHIIHVTTYLHSVLHIKNICDGKVYFVYHIIYIINTFLSTFTTIQVADALDMPFEDNTFGLAWSLESGEHMPDKAKFVNELMRVIAPGGRVIIVTWCHRDLEPGEPSLSKKEEKILAKINRAYYLPKWCSVADYVNLLEKEGAVDIKREDWSYIIAPFWKAVIKSSLNLKSVVGLLKSGFSTIRGAYAMLLMLKGFDSGVIKFGLITCTKKEEAKKEEIKDEDTTKEE